MQTGIGIEWAPSQKAFLMYQFSRNLWLYDPAAAKWEELQSKGPAIGGGYEGVSCFDSKRNQLIVLNNEGAKMGIYDVESNTWLEPTDEFSPGEASGRSYHTTKSSAHYDSVNDVVVLFHDGQGQKGAWIYDCEKGKWLNREPLPDSQRKGMSSFYSESANAHYFFDCGDSRTTPGDIWVWRYKG